MEHFCIVVEDIEEAVDYFSKMGYNFEPIHIRARSPTENPVILRGTPISYTLRAAVAKNTTPALELTQIIEGDPLKKNSLKPKDIVSTMSATMYQTSNKPSPNSSS